ncbi:PDZ domain-containing protein [Streptomyces griseoluteus]|uniref:PDZ domain-containing protein n=1 Tax=Streptomyces griseoluteus TaxID=29306 RepID=A0A4Z1DQR9_STRGP|nr:trypsin-like peptidase domain-containing protein [Streptomyces griseoluteus]TGN85827.1 PDZ domain-containing protein [Streptomyces griseoluteus]GHE90900.1 protease [Streptomyces griseoluteus]
MDASRIRAGRRGAVAVVLVCAAVLGGGCSSPAAKARKDGPPTAQAALPMAADDLQDQYQKVIKDVLRSVVQIQAGPSLGSGVIYGDKGHIVTNAHVIGSEKTFRVTTARSEDPLTATLVYSYPEQDLAVIKLDKAPAGLHPAVFGDSDKVEVGQIVLAMGSPLGLASSVTQGIVSATGRTVSEPGGDGSPGATIPNMVQTSAAINPGNSGGALVNLNSQVIGIPTLGATDPGMQGGAAPGIGFAIPASMVRTVAGQIIATGKVTDSGRAALGVTVRTVVDEGYRPAGAAVVTVQRGGPAAKAGLEAGDVITRLGDSPVDTATELAAVLAGKKPGEKVTVTYERSDSRHRAEVTLGEQ